MWIGSPDSHVSYYAGSHNYQVQHTLTVDLLSCYPMSRTLLNGLPEELQLTLWCQGIWTDSAVVRRGVVLHDVPPLVCWSRSPVMSKLLLQFSAPEPVETHVHCFCAFLLDGVGDNTHRCCVISFHGCRGLSMSHLFEG